MIMIIKKLWLSLLRVNTRDRYEFTPLAFTIYIVGFKIPDWLKLIDGHDIESISFTSGDSNK